MANTYQCILRPSCYSEHFSLYNSHSSSEIGISIPILQMRKLRLSNFLKASYLVSSETEI